MNSRLFIMPSSSIFFLFSTAFSATSALPWTGPKATATYDAVDWSPRPTLASISERELFPRAPYLGSNTCGFAGGDYYSSITCGSASSCVWDISRNYVGCCPKNGICTTGVYTSCVDIQSGQQTVVDPAVTTCSGASVCYLNSFPKGYHQYGCGAANMAAVVETTFFSEPSSWNLQVATTVLDIPAARTIAAAVNSAVAITSGSSSGKPTATPGASHSSKMPVGSIVAIVIGSIAFLIAAVVVGMYLFRKRKEYYRRRPGRQSARLARDSSKKSTPEKAQSSNAAFHRISNSISSPIPPEMRIAKTPTFPPPPESHKNSPAPRYFTEDRSPPRSPWSQPGHVPPRWSPKRLSPVSYVPYVPKPKSTIQISPVTAPLAYEPLRFSPKPMSPIQFTPIQEKQREGDKIPISPGFQNTEMSPIAFAPNDRENEPASMEPRRMSPVAYLPRRGGQSPVEARNMPRELTRSPSQQSLLQETGAARDFITPSPSGSQQPLLQSHNNNNRELISPSPRVHIPLEPVELPCPTPVRDTHPGRRTSSHKKNASSTSSRTVRYSPMPPIASTPPRETKRKPISKFADRTPTPPNTNSYNHIALQLAGSPSRSLPLKPKSSLQNLNTKTPLQTLTPKPSSQIITPKSSLKNLAPLRPLRTNLPTTNLNPNLTTRSVSPSEKEELAQKFRIKASSPKNITPTEFEQAIAQKGGRKGSSDKIERILGLVNLSGVKARGSKEKNVEVRMGKNIKSAYIEESGIDSRIRAESATSCYDDDDDNVLAEVEDRSKEGSMSICSANILDVGGEDLGMGTLQFSMEKEMFDELMREEGVKRGGEKGVKWRDEVGSGGGELAVLRGETPRLGTPVSGRVSEWGRMEPLRGGNGEGGWL